MNLDIVGYELSNNKSVCVDCYDEEIHVATDAIMVKEIEKGAVIYCDVCKKKIEI